MFTIEQCRAKLDTMSPAEIGDFLYAISTARFRGAVFPHSADVLEHDYVLKACETSKEVMRQKKRGGRLGIRNNMWRPSKGHLLVLSTYGDIFSSIFDFAAMSGIYTDQLFPYIDRFGKEFPLPANMDVTRIPASYWLRSLDFPTSVHPKELETCLRILKYLVTSVKKDSQKLASIPQLERDRVANRISAYINDSMRAWNAERWRNTPAVSSSKRPTGGWETILAILIFVKHGIFSLEDLSAVFPTKTYVLFGLIDRVKFSDISKIEMLDILPRMLPSTEGVRISPNAKPVSHHAGQSDWAGNIKKPSYR